MKLKRILLSLVVVGCATSCSYDNPMVVSVESSSVTVFYGDVRVPGGDEVSGPGFIFGPVTLTWKGTQPLQLFGLAVEFPASGKFSADFTCTFDSEKLADAFPSANGLVLQPGNVYVSSGQFVCTGIAAKNDKATFIATGEVRARGYTGQAGTQKFFKGTTRLSLYWFPEGD